MIVENENFKFNSTDELLFTKFGEEWLLSVERSFHMCIQCHVNFYYNGSAPNDLESITSKTYSELNLCKYFCDVKEHRDFFTHNWAKKTLNLCMSSKRDGRDFSRMYELIPDYVTKAKVTKTTYDILKRSLKWFLYCLWYHNAVLLPVTLSFPRNARGKNGYEPLFEYYPELMRLLRSPYCMHNFDIHDIRPHIVSCGFSEDQIRDYAYKIITASTWRNVEDVTIHTASIMSHDISKAIAMGRSSYKNNLPIIPLLKLLVSMYPSRCSFELRDINAYATSKRSRAIKISDNGSYTLCKNHSRVIWESLLSDFIEMLTKKGRAVKTIYHYKCAFNMFVSHLYKNNPLVIVYPKDYTRGTFLGKNGGSAFQNEITSFDANVQYAILKRLEIFFNWVSIQKHLVYVSEFSSPISKFDFPRVSHPRGTNKIIPPTHIFIRLYSFISTLCDFYWWLITNKKYQPGLALNKKCYDTQSLGMTPIVWIEGKALPIYYIPCKLTGEAISSIKNATFHFPIFQTLFGLFVEMETGIRTIHICWLSHDHFDKYCKDDWSDYKDLVVLPEIQYDAIKMVISSDKVKPHAWEAYVSTRVIRMIKRQKLFLATLDGDIPALWYNKSLNSIHGKIKSIFHLKELGSRQSEPIGYESIRKQFNRVQLFFDLWQCSHYKTWLEKKVIFENEFEITQLNDFDGKVKAAYDKSMSNGARFNDVINETFYYCGSYRTNYTPHGIRASVVSQRVTLLPPDLIAKYITGHETINSLAHYVVLDDSMLRNVTRQEITNIYKDGVQLTPPKSLEAFKTEVINRKIQEVISKNPSEFYEAYTPVSFSKEPDEKKESTKFNINAVSNASFFTTHICPYNKKCPDDVIKSTGEYMCGQCYASIKTIAHIPRILAHMRTINLDLTVLRSRIEAAIVDQADPEAIAPLDYDYRRLANELAAWVHTYGVLKNNFDKKEAHDKYFILNPDLVSMKIMESNCDKNELAVFILMLNDAQEFVEYNTPNLKAQIALIASKIKMNNQLFSIALSQAGEYSLLDELRGIIKTCSDVYQVSYSNALEMLLREQPVPTNIQLE